MGEAGSRVSLCFAIHALAKSVNDWRRGKGHWTAITRQRDRMRDAFAVEFNRSGGVPAGVPGPVHVALTFYWPNRLRRDPDNYAKQVLDALVYFRLIEDDGPPVMVSLTLAARWDAAEPRIEVRVEQAGAPAWPLPKRRKAKAVR